MDIADKIIEAARAGGNIIRKYFRSDNFTIEEKGAPDNLVTDIDYQVQEKVSGILKKSFPDAVIISEEDSRHEAENRTIYIDPLDGTLNFVHGYDQLAVSIGIWDNNDPVAGVVYNPITENIYHAVTGQGAYWNRKKIRCSGTSQLSHSLVATGWPYDRGTAERVLNTISRFWIQSQEIRTSGSAALNVCHVASAVFDGYWEDDIFPWDFAAGAVIALEAGCTISSLKGGPFKIEGKEILVSNPQVHEQMIRVLEGGAHG